MLALAAAPASAGGYRPVALPCLGGPCRAFGISETGTVVGLAVTASGETHAVRWSRGGDVEDLGTAGGTFGLAFDAGARGWATGYGTDASGATRALLWPANGAALDLGTLPGDAEAFAFGTNERGEVVGFSRRGLDEDRAFLFTERDGMVELPGLGGPSQAYYVSRSGDAVGTSRDGSGQDRAALWSRRRGLVDLGPGYALRIDDRGTVVGFTPATRPFLWTDEGGQRDLGTLGGTTGIAYAVSHAGAVVGQAADASGSPRAFIWTEDSGMVDLNTLVDAAGGLTLTFARAIDGAGRIAGYGVLDGVVRAVLLVPEP